jgi:hypothetical protein
LQAFFRSLIGHFVNFPSKLIGKDGRSAWLCYAANFTNGYLHTNYRDDPPGGGYGMSLKEIRLLGPSCIGGGTTHMSSMPTAAWMGVAGLFVSLVNLLWILSAGLRTRSSIRAMICIEIEENLARLREFQLKASQAPTFTEGHPLSAVQKCDALRLKALPRFNHSVWRSLTASIPTALSPKKITSVYRFHGELDELVAPKERRDLGPSDHAAAIEKALTRAIEDGNRLS